MPLSEPRRLDPWTQIVPTVDGLVLFYRGDTRAAAPGGSSTGRSRTLKSFTGFDLWSHVVSIQ